MPVFKFVNILKYLRDLKKKKNDYKNGRGGPGKRGRQEESILYGAKWAKVSEFGLLVV